ncbi:hypothetical protein [Streptomyces sp. NPDC059787]|uniref:hypothetical protein n=1 Tax=Streptomyces sp. NPDC059787 TaxID=3346947 RepID=UPI003659939C
MSLRGRPERPAPPRSPAATTCPPGTCRIGPVVDGPSRPAHERLLAACDRDRGTIIDLTALPACPYCGGVFLHARVGPGFIDDALMPTGHRLTRRLSALSADARLLVVEIGTDFDIPASSASPPSVSPTTVPTPV